MEAPAPHTPGQSSPIRPLRTLKSLAIAASIGVLLGVGCGVWLATELEDAIAGDRTLSRYDFGEFDTVTSLDGRHVAILASREVGNSREEAVAIRGDGPVAHWHVPYAWGELSVRNVGWRDNVTLEITGYERLPGAAREPVILDELGVTVECRVLERPAEDK